MPENTISKEIKDKISKLEEKKKFLNSQIQEKQKLLKQLEPKEVQEKYDKLSKKRDEIKSEISSLKKHLKAFKDVKEYGLTSQLTLHLLVALRFKINLFHIFIKNSKTQIKLEEIMADVCKSLTYPEKLLEDKFITKIATKLIKNYDFSERAAAIIALILPEISKTTMLKRLAIAEKKLRDFLKKHHRELFESALNADQSKQAIKNLKNDIRNDRNEISEIDKEIIQLKNNSNKKPSQDKPNNEQSSDTGLSLHALGSDFFDKIKEYVKLQKQVEEAKQKYDELLKNAQKKSENPITAGASAQYPKPNEIRQERIEKAKEKYSNLSNKESQEFSELLAEFQAALGNATIHLSSLQLNIIIIWYRFTQKLNKATGNFDKIKSTISDLLKDKKKAEKVFKALEKQKKDQFVRAHKQILGSNAGEIFDQYKKAKKALNDLKSEKTQLQKELQNNDINPDDIDLSFDDSDNKEKEKIGFKKGKEKNSKKALSSDATSQTPKNSKDNFAGDNVKPNTTTDNDEEYIFIIDPIEKKVVRKKIKKQAKPLTHEEIEKHLKELQKFTVVLPESDYFISSEKPNQIKKLPEFYVVEGTTNHKTLIEGQKYWTKKLIQFYSNPFKKGPVEKPKPIDAEMSKIDVATLVVFTAAIAAILKKLNKFKGKIKTVQNKITQTKSGKLSRMKLKSSNNKKLSKTKNVSQAKGKVTKGGLKLNGKNIGQSNSSGNPKLKSVGKGNRQGGSNKVGTRISGRPAVGRCSSWAQSKHNSQFAASGTPMLNNGSGGAGGPYANSKY